jgi:hypothetical protein
MMAAENAPFQPPAPGAPLPGPRSRVAKILNAAQCGKEPVSTGSGLGGRGCASGFVSPGALPNDHFERPY